MIFAVLFVGTFRRRAQNFTHREEARLASIAFPARCELLSNFRRQNWGRRRPCLHIEIHFQEISVREAGVFLFLLLSITSGKKSEYSHFPLSVFLFAFPRVVRENRRNETDGFGRQ